MMIDLEQAQDGISRASGRINDVDGILVSRPACGIYSAVPPKNIFLVKIVGPEKLQNLIQGLHLLVTSPTTHALTF